MCVCENVIRSNVIRTHGAYECVFIFVIVMYFHFRISSINTRQHQAIQFVVVVVIDKRIPLSIKRINLSIQCVRVFCVYIGMNAEHPMQNFHIDFTVHSATFSLLY